MIGCDWSGCFWLQIPSTQSPIRQKAVCANWKVSRIASTLPPTQPGGALRWPELLVFYLSQREFRGAVRKEWVKVS